MSYTHDHENEVTYFGKTNFRNQMTKFGIKTDDRRRHMYVIGKTGMGKTTLMENLILSDIYAGHGCCYVDPHGDTAEKLINYIPSWRYNDVVYFNPADLEFPVGFNILEAVSESHKHLVASGMMGVFAKIWEGMWSARMEYILNNTILALLDNPGQTLLGINRMMSDAEYRNRMVGNVQDPVVKAFWLKEFASWSEKYQTEATAAIQNKIGQFLSAGVIRNIVSQVKSTINVRQIMDDDKIFIINLSKGRIGEDNSKLIGGLLITKIQLSAMERVDTPEEDRHDFYLYVDEFQNFAVESFANILSEARKYRLCLIMAHQYIAQLTEPVRDAVFGNVGTMVTFRVGSPDALFMEQEFTPRLTPEDIINLPKYNIYLKLLIDGVTSQPFSAFTLPPIAQITNSAEKVIKVSRERYATPRSEIEDNIKKWSGLEDVSDEEMLQKAKDKQQRSSGGKPRFEYKCTRCDTDIVLPVELDRSRPIYCDDCIKIVREERKGGKSSKGNDKKNSSSSNNDDKKQKKPAPPVNPKDSEPIEKLPDEPSISLNALTGDKQKKEDKKEVEKKKEAPPERKPEKQEEQKPETQKERTSESKNKDDLMYNCSDCDVRFEAPVKLDPSRPVYCKDCLEKVREQRKKSKDQDSKKNKDSQEKKKGKKRKDYSYKCTDCDADFTAPVKLDPSRPMYCEPCLEKVRQAKRKEEESSKKKEPESVPETKSKPKPKPEPRIKEKAEVPSEKESKQPEPKTEPKQSKETQETNVEKETKKEQKPQSSGTLRSGQSVNFDY